MYLGFSEYFTQGTIFWIGEHSWVVGACLGKSELFVKIIGIWMPNLSKKNSPDPC